MFDELRQVEKNRVFPKNIKLIAVGGEYNPGKWEGYYKDQVEIDPAIIGFDRFQIESIMYPSA